MLGYVDSQKETALFKKLSNCHLRSNSRESVQKDLDLDMVDSDDHMESSEDEESPLSSDESETSVGKVLIVEPFNQATRDFATGDICLSPTSLYDLSWKSKQSAPSSQLLSTSRRRASINEDDCSTPSDNTCQTSRLHASKTSFSRPCHSRRRPRPLNSDLVKSTCKVANIEIEVDNSSEDNQGSDESTFSSSWDEEIDQRKRVSQRLLGTLGAKVNQRLRQISSAGQRCSSSSLQRPPSLDEIWTRTAGDILPCSPAMQGRMNSSPRHVSPCSPVRQQFGNVQVVVTPPTPKVASCSRFNSGIVRKLRSSYPPPSEFIPVEQGYLTVPPFDVTPGRHIMLQQQKAKWAQKRWLARSRQMHDIHHLGLDSPIPPKAHEALLAAKLSNFPMIVDNGPSETFKMTSAPASKMKFTSVMATTRNRYLQPVISIPSQPIKEIITHNYNQTNCEVTCAGRTFAQVCSSQVETYTTTFSQTFEQQQDIDHGWPCTFPNTSAVTRKEAGRYMVARLGQRTEANKVDTL